jgi:glycerol uptake facilitator-like aquaporin
MESHLTTMQLIRNSILKLFFEMLGTGFLTLTFNCTLYKGATANFSMNQTSLLLVLWVLTIFGLKISGAHYNPAISFAFMLRKDVGNFPRPLAIAYILFQCLGGFLGAVLSWFLRVDIMEFGSITLRGSEFKYVLAAMVAETIGSFFVSFFYLTQTEEKTVFSKEKAINCFIIASAYVGGRAMLFGNYITLSGAVLNPAIALGTSFC